MYQATLSQQEAMYLDRAKIANDYLKANSNLNGNFHFICSGALK